MSAESVEIYIGEYPFRVRSRQEGGGNELLIAREKKGGVLASLDLAELGPDVELKVKELPAVLGSTANMADYQILVVKGNDKIAAKVRAKLLQQLANKSD